MCDLAVVLGGGLGEAGKMRTLKGVELIKNGVCKQLLLVGNRDEVEYMTHIALREGISPEKLLSDPNSEDTLDNAYYAKLIAQKVNAKNIALVTSDFHMERALKIFQHVFGSSYIIEPYSVHDTPTQEALKREEILKSLLPLLKLFKEGDHESIVRIKKTLKTLAFF
ncbi:MAG: hypothetical protein B7O98_08900 [Zestosphaera tikiterensis]|uniref:DUF218 domain-containing protein n=1 Tax=Zestosphaera tikiterensis TaxID=1973259 RepID=A0A2R7Y2E6_9CREN|nr:MAG: hypothetical protein B7O98_08730 [Zestosphaera tikiterensis]PUA31731.1 MAG: hypothetical protein B7O98_08900 [Zestosphaera tikiterensis]